MTRSPSVTVVIPAYNAMRYLPLTLESALKQDYGDYEIIVVDDGSADHLVSWMSSRGHERVRLVSQHNGGLANARNRGIRESCSEFVAFLDADDVWRPDKLSKQVRLLRSNDAVGVVYAGVEIIDNAGRTRGRRILNHERGSVWRTLLTRNIVECGSTPMVRRACFDRVGLFDETLGSHVEDRDMWLRIAAHYDFDTVPEPLVLYRHHVGSASSDWRSMERSTVAVNDKALAANPLGLDAAELERLRRRSYAAAYLRLAWKPLQGKGPDLAGSLRLARTADGYDRLALLNKERWKLVVAQALLLLVGPSRYHVPLRMRDRIRKAASRLFQAAPRS